VAARRDFRDFSPSADWAVDLSDLAAAQNSSIRSTRDRKDRKSPRSISLMAELSGLICEAEQFFLGMPSERKVATAGRQILSGEFRRLTACGNSFDDRRCEKGQSNHATDVTLADTFPVANLDH
jgi:hypothetical protein